MQYPKALYCFHHKDPMYRLKTPQLDLCVTPNHYNLVDITSTKHKITDEFQFVRVDQLFGKRARYKKDGVWQGRTGMFCLPGYTEACGRAGAGTKFVPPVYKDPAKLFPLIGLYITDGCTSVSKSGYRVYISRKTPEKNILI